MKPIFQWVLSFMFIFLNKIIISKSRAWKRPTGVLLHLDSYLRGSQAFDKSYWNAHELINCLVLLLASYNLFLQRKKKRHSTINIWKSQLFQGISIIRSICFSFVVYCSYFQAILSQVFRDTLYGNQNKLFCWSLPK